MKVVSACLSLMLYLTTVQDIEVNNISFYVGKNRWHCTLFVNAAPVVLDKIKCVEYTLHPTFPNPIQVVCDRGTNDHQAFPLETDAWSEFTVKAKVTFVDRAPQLYTYSLRLTETTKEQICSKPQILTLQKGDIVQLEGSLQYTYVYLKEVHKSHPSHLVILNTRERLDPYEFDWGKTERSLRESRTGTLEDGRYRKISAATNNAIDVVLGPGRRMSIVIIGFLNHRLVVRICE